MVSPSRLNHSACLDPVPFLPSLLQDFQSDPFRHLSTYLCLSLVVAQFMLSCLADQPPLFPKDPQQSVSCHVSNPLPPWSLSHLRSQSPQVTGGSCRPLMFYSPHHSAICVLHGYSMPWLANFFCPAQGRKYFRCCGPYDLCGYSALLRWHKSSPTVCQQRNMDVFQ